MREQTLLKYVEINETARGEMDLGILAYKKYLFT